MSVVDCFLFSDELDMLECRLHELGEVVDWFVLVEGDRTFQGDPKDSVYDTNRERFANWSDRIVHVIAELPDGDAWTRERAQREAIFDGLQALPLEPEDTLVLSDVDEIWRPSIAVSDLPRPFAVLSLTMYIHNFGWRHPDRWDGPVVVHLEDLPPTFDILRYCRNHPRPPRVMNGGWHLSWFGGDDASRRKQFSFSHTEYRTVDMVAHRVNGLHIDGTVLEQNVNFEDVPKWIPAGWLP